MSMPPSDKWLSAFRRLVVGHQEQLCALICQEIHKTPFEALTGDVLPLLASLRWHERHAGAILRPRRARGKPFFMLGQSATLTRAPLGVVGIIATWNYPVQLLGIQLTAAIAAGNRVVVKPSERSPQTQALLLDLAAQALVIAGLPADTLMRLPATRQAGEQMLADHASGAQALDHVVFTGSTAVGQQIAMFAAQHLLSSTLELSGNDSALVLDDADAAMAAKSIWHAVTMNGGQTCMAPRRVLVMPGAYAEFCKHLGDLAATTTPRQLIDAAAADRCRELAGKQAERQSAQSEQGAMYRPTAVFDAAAASAVVAGDHFGPLLAVVRCSSLEEALDTHAAAGQHLSVSVYTRNVDHVRDTLAGQLGASQVNINDTLLPTAHPGTAIAGHARSGWGASRGEAGLLAMTRPVAVTVTGRWLRTPLAEPSARVVGNFKAFMRFWFGR